MKNINPKMYCYGEDEGGYCIKYLVSRACQSSFIYRGVNILQMGCIEDEEGKGNPSLCCLVGNIIKKRNKKKRMDIMCPHV